MKGKGNGDEDMWPRILHNVEILVNDTATVYGRRNCLVKYKLILRSSYMHVAVNVQITSTLVRAPEIEVRPSHHRLSSYPNRHCLLFCLRHLLLRRRFRTDNPPDVAGAPVLPPGVAAWTLRSAFALSICVCFVLIILVNN